jgi:hypothetical protein
MEKTWKPTTAGILAIVAGAIQVIFGTLCTAGVGFLGGILGIAWLSVICTPLVIFGIIAITGGICALRRRIWGLALAGAVLALVGPWFILGILAIVFVSLGKREFE